MYVVQKCHTGKIQLEYKKHTYTLPSTLQSQTLIAVALSAEIASLRSYARCNMASFLIRNCTRAFYESYAFRVQ